ncbi:MAG TPA: MFS transporter [Methylomirabilota bacterium]
MRRSLSQSPGRVFYGWWIVAIGCVQDAVKGGLFNTGFTLYFLPVLTELNLSRAATSLPFSLSRLEAALGAPFVGYLIDRFDVRVMLVAGTLLAGLGLVLLSLTHSYLLFVLVFIGPLSFGFQAGFNQATLAVVAHWFRRKRGLAMAIVQTGQAIGGVLIFPLVALAVLKLGWRAAAVLSGLAVFMLLPLVLLIRRSPESMGLLPDGESSARSGASGLAAPLVDAREYTTREALKTPTFWLLAAFHGLRNVPYAGVTVHLVPLLVWKGLDEAGAAFYVGLTALATVVIRPLTGWLGDRQSKQRVGAIGVLLGAAGLAVLAYGGGAWWALLLFAVLFSFGDGVNSVTWALVGDVFGRAHFASIRGWISMFQSFASMPAAVYTGWVYDRTQSYTQALLAFVVCYGAAAVVLWLIPLPARPERLQVAAGRALGASS